MLCASMREEVSCEKYVLLLQGHSVCIICVSVHRLSCSRLPESCCCCIARVEALLAPVMRHDALAGCTEIDIALVTSFEV